LKDRTEINKQKLNKIEKDATEQHMNTSDAAETAREHITKQ